MKTIETKKVIPAKEIAEIKYVAEDGKEFFYKSECENYEKEIWKNKLLSNIKHKSIPYNIEFLVDNDSSLYKWEFVDNIDYLVLLYEKFESSKLVFNDETINVNDLNKITDDKLISLINKGIWISYKTIYINEWRNTLVIYSKDYCIKMVKNALKEINSFLSVLQEL